ncbi:MAG: alpha-amylase family glycosyl hydrolase [Candidatus Competibacteraceae bacterium]
MSYFAPHPSYCISPEAGNHVREFRDMVKALHKAGIEVILDVVFNHTDEGNHQGPVFSFKGIDNSNYYYLSPLDRRYYYDYTGCGNTFNCNHPIGGKIHCRMPEVLGQGNACGRFSFRRSLSAVSWRGWSADAVSACIMADRTG